MFQIRPQPGFRGIWEVVDETEHPLLLIEVKNVPPECTVRRFRGNHNKGRGELITKFLGKNSFESACKWILTDEVPRILHSESNKGCTVQDVLSPSESVNVQVELFPRISNDLKMQEY